MKKTIRWMVLVAGALLASSAAIAQTQTVANGVHIYTEPANLYFSVDGERFFDQAYFFWPQGSKHVITSWDQRQAGTLFKFVGVYTNLSSENVAGMPITADPALKWIKIVFETWYLLTISLPDCGTPLPHPSGVIEVNEQPYICHKELWFKAGSSIHAKAFPNEGYIFTGWGFVWRLDHPTQYDITFPMLGPLTLAAFFWPADAVTATVNVITAPAQLKVFMDQTPYTAPMTLELGWGTTHVLGTDPVQMASGQTYVFSSWSDGGAINHDFQVPNQMATLTFTANFVPAYKVSFLTSPPGLTLTIDGRQNWPNYFFSWLPGSTHQISAPETQTDAKGHKYRFVSWSNGKSASYDFTAGAAPGDDNITALYQAVGQATVTSDPPGLDLLVDGAPCATPCKVEKDTGASINVSAPTMQSATDRTRLIFHGWRDAPDASRVIALTPDLKTYVASYTMQNRLSLAASPTEGASFLINPASDDGFYDAGVVVSIAAKLALGFRINHWSGDLTGGTSLTALALDAPKSAILMLDRLPAIAPLGVQNAAAGANPDRVAPGSLISIFGANLAPDFFIGPSNHLAQTLGNVTVRVDDSFLPLVYVSPQQINAQLPAGTSEGSHNIIVRWEGHPEVTAPVLVARNAPGLFNTGPQSQPAGSFVRPDGSMVTAEVPARPGEVLGVLGTGLGPYLVQPPDGFLFDESSGYALADTVTVVLGESVALDSTYAGRSGSGVGVDCVRFMLPASLPSGAAIPVRIRVNGQESNNVFLPIANAPIQP